MPKRFMLALVLALVAAFSAAVPASANELSAQPISISVDPVTGVMTITNDAGIQVFCESSSFCLWDGMNFTGASRSIPVSLVVGCFNLNSVGFSNRADSGVNNTGFNMRGYDSATCGGSSFYWPDRAQTSNFNAFYGNNRISGFALTG